MYRAMLVDDEIWSVRGLQKLLPWRDKGFEIIALETDAVVALEQLRELSPDVVFTDIRMPEVSGLELMRRAHEFRPELTFVVVSGHNDFAYAQESLRHGAFDYFLKPIDREDGSKLLDRLRAKLAVDRVQGDASHYADLLAGGDRAAPMFGSLGQRIGHSDWTVVVINSPDGEVPEEVISRTFGDRAILSLRPQEGKTVTILRNSPGADRTNDWVSSALGALRNMHVGVSREGKSIDQLPMLLREAEIAAAGGFVGNSPRIVRFSSESHDDLKTLMVEITHSLASYNKIRACLLVDKLAVVVRREHLGVFHVEAFWNRIHSFVKEWESRVSRDHPEPAYDSLSIISAFHNLDDFCAYMKKAIVLGVDATHLHTTKSGKVNPRFLEILDFVISHFAEPISLACLANEYGLNLSYCCELFKKHTGSTFSRYVTKLRMNAAWRMISFERCAARDVAEKVGYPDYYHFSRLFKRHFGVSPSQVRPSSDCQVTVNTFD